MQLLRRVNTRNSIVRGEGLDADHGEGSGPVVTGRHLAQFRDEQVACRSRQVETENFQDEVLHA